MTIEELKARATAMHDFLDSRAWKDFFAPWLDEQIRKNIDIRAIQGQNDDEVLMNLRQRKTKIDIYQNILRLPEEWIKEAEAKEKRGVIKDAR